MTDCLFCKIATGEMKTSFVFEDEDVVAFQDITPQAPHHLLVIPRQHISSLAVVEGKEGTLLAGKVMAVCAQIARDKGWDEQGFRAVTNTGSSAGQSVFHWHVHLLAGRPFSWPPG